MKFPSPGFDPDWEENGVTLVFGISPFSLSYIHHLIQQLYAISAEWLSG